MDKEQLQSYANRITQANRTELTVIVYEIIISDLDSAIARFDSGEMEEFTKDLQHAQKFMNELISTLDFHYVLSFDLMQLYLYVNRRMIKAAIRRDAQPLPSARKVMQTLLVGFKEVAKQDTSEPLMQNTQQIYAGLTYGKGVLNETTIDPKQHNRGFKA